MSVLPLTEKIVGLLKAHADLVHPVIDADLSSKKVVRLDFTRRNPTLAEVNLQHTPTFARFVQELLAQQGAEIGIGGYLEPRIIYRRSALFGSTAETRSVHLGVDIWTEAGTRVFSPLPAVVHSFADNTGFGNYGPTLILEHQIERHSFFTLYGHLSRNSITGLYPGQPVAAGDQIGKVGPYPENGDWPPHLHFQLITDLEGRSGDFPGVAAPAEVAQFAALCPDPNLILRSRHLLFQ
jgi:peptidoglycan LD-endopeptidase LytH